MAKWFTYVDKLKPDIAISSHPFVDGSIRRMELIRECDDQTYAATTYAAPTTRF